MKRQGKSQMLPGENFDESVLLTGLLYLTTP